MLKKVLALFTTLAIILSMGTVTVFAADLEGTGETTWVDEDTGEIMLPTNALGNWDFVLDPQGLIGAARAGLFVDGATEVDKETLAPFAGKILARDYSPVVFNQFSYDVVLGIDVTIIGDDDDFVVVDDEDVVEKDDTKAKNILLNANIAKEPVTVYATSGVTFATAGVTVAEPLDTETKTLEFVLGHPEYVYTNPSQDGKTFEYVLKTGETGYGTQLQLGGLINQNADWSDYIGDNPSKTIGVEASFTVKKATPDDIAKLDTIDGEPNPYKGSAYGYIGLLAAPSTDTEVTWNTLTANGTTGSVTTDELTLTFDVDPTTLAKSDITVTGATLDSMSGTGTTRTLAISDITVADGATVKVDIASPDGYTIAPDSKTVVVNVAPVNTAVAWNGLTANGTTGSVTTDELTLTFDVDPTTLAESDITVTGATLDSMSGTGTIRTLAISNITVANSADVTVTIASPAGYAISGSPKTVAVYKAAAPGFPGTTGPTQSFSKAAPADLTYTFNAAGGTIAITDATTSWILATDYTYNAATNTLVLKKEKISARWGTSGNGLKAVTITVTGGTAAGTYTLDINLGN